MFKSKGARCQEKLKRKIKTPNLTYMKSLCIHLKREKSFCMPKYKFQPYILVKKSYSPHIIPKTEGLEESLYRRLTAITSSVKIKLVSRSIEKEVKIMFLQNNLKYGPQSDAPIVINMI